MKCKFCHTRKQSIYCTLKREGDPRYFRCASCHSVSLEKKFWPGNMDAHYSSEFYREDFSEKSRDDNVRRYTYRLKHLQSLFSTPGRFLEIGSGGGDYLSLVREANWDAHGVELSSRAAKIAKEKFKLPIFCGETKDAPYERESFDCVAMYHSLEHIPDPQRELELVSRLLKPGGKLIIELPNLESIDVWLSPHLLEESLSFPHHLYLAPAQVIKEELEKLGLHVGEVSYHNSFLLGKGLRSLVNFFSRRPTSSKNASKEQNTRERKKESLPTKKTARSRFRVGFSRLLPGMQYTIVAQKRK